jgi:molybdopterin molybdotransferase
VLTPGAVGLAAALGVPSLLVGVRPRVAVLSTGDEVVEPGFALGPGQIHSSNTHALAALVTQAGGVPVDLGNVRDDPAAIGEAFARAAACDLVVSTGGVSVGDFDHVKGVIGGGVEFWRVAMKPGKPLAFGHVGGKPTFGLPGNPVSCMVNFLQFVRPVVRAMLGDRAPFLPVLRVPLERAMKRQPGRPEFLRVTLALGPDGPVARAAGGHQGSGNVLSMAHAHGFVLVDAHATEVSGLVPVQVFDTSFLASEHAGYAWTPAPGGGAADPCC